MAGRALRILPVLDVLQGQAVHAVGGIRSQYRPLQTCLHPSASPIEIARAYRDALGLNELYLADLDAITGGPAHRELYRILDRLDIRLWIDAGVKSERDLAVFADLPTATVVVGLETLAGANALGAILDRAGPDRVVLSLDRFEGALLVAPEATWGTADPAQLAQQAINLGLRRMLLLDLARVGTGRGTGSDALLEWLRVEKPDLEISIGGGIRGVEEIETLRAAGADLLLLGSALHDGRITRREIDAIHRNR